MRRYSISMKVFVLFCCLWAVIVDGEYLKYKDPKQPMVTRIKDLMNRMTLEEKIGQMTQIERYLASADVMKQYFIVIVDGEYLKYKDPKQPMVTRIKDLMNRMTLEEKIGQMTQIERYLASADVMKQYFIGSVLSVPGSVPAPKATAEDWINAVNEIQKGALSTRLGIPMIYGIDAVHGHNNVYNATIFPHNIGLGVTRQRIGAATALEVRATGIPYAFAPCIAVCRDPRWGRCYESYSEDHKIVRTMTEIIPGLQGDLPADSRKGVPFVGGNACWLQHVTGPIMVQHSTYLDDDL
ncbi:hypothetical protein BC332_15624 [Capsicum chinense]|nr:hypothetical protein BC332_15624 [Capsicum chinense]